MIPAPAIDGGEGPRRVPRWGLVVAIVVPALMAAGLYWDVVLAMARQWYRDENFSHGFLVPLVAAYLVWERRAALAVPARPSRWGRTAGRSPCRSRMWRRSCRP